MGNDNKQSKKFEPETMEPIQQFMLILRFKIITKIVFLLHSFMSLTVIGSNFTVYAIFIWRKLIRFFVKK